MSQKSDTANNDVFGACLMSNSVGELASALSDEIDLRLSSNTKPLLYRVDTSDSAQHQMTHLNGNHCLEDCSESTRNTENADDNARLANASEVGVNLVLETENNKRASKARMSSNDNRTSVNLNSSGALCMSNTPDDETATSTNDLSIFGYSNSNRDRKRSAGYARNSRTLRSRSAIECATSNKASLVGDFPAIEYPKSYSDGTSAISDARNDNKIVQRREYEGALAKVGDFDREREIERRMRELGLWEYKRVHELQLAEMLDKQISERDGLSAAIRRCKRRHREQAHSAADDVRYHVNHHFIRCPFSLATCFHFIVKILSKFCTTFWETRRRRDVNLLKTITYRICKCCLKNNIDDKYCERKSMVP